MGFYQKMRDDRTRGQKYTYKILQANEVRQDIKERALAIATCVRSEDEAYQLMGHDGFSYQKWPTGRVGVIKYNGIEVMLLFKRVVNEHEPGPADPVPEKALVEPEDAWIQIPLLSLDEASQEKGVQANLRVAFERARKLELLYNRTEEDAKDLRNQLEKLEPVHTQLKEHKVKLDIASRELEAKTGEVELHKGQLLLERNKRREDKMQVVRDLFPIFNTVWLAGQHRVGDPLYAILRKQLTEALAKVGAELVEPKLGDEFDPALHHAVHSFLFAPGAREIGTVVQVNRVGWKLTNGPLIEAAEVAVGVEREEEVKEDATNDVAGVQGQGDRGGNPICLPEGDQGAQEAGVPEGVRDLSDTGDSGSI